jgi:hypothetical protein
MDDDRDSDSADFSTLHDRPALVSPDTARLLIAAGVGFAVGAVVSFLFEADFGRSGDEAPIRVKGGSTNFELLGGKQVWTPDSGQNHWKPSAGTRGRDDYKIILAVFDNDGNSQSTTLYGKKIRVYQDQQNFVQIKSVGKHTKLEPHRAVKSKPGAPHVLTHPYNIERIQVDASIVYFEQDARFDYMLLLDY